MTEKKYINTTAYFYGSKISDYGIENGFVDYFTLARSFNHVLNNDIMEKTQDVGYWDVVNGFEYDEESDTYKEFFQFYIIDDNGFEILSELTNETVFYNEHLNMYVWAVDHLGTSWDCVLTEIPVKLEEKKMLITNKNGKTTEFIINPSNLNKWIRQNNAKYTGNFVEGCLLDNFVVITNRGFAAFYEKYINPNMSTYAVEFQQGAAQDVFKNWYQFEMRANNE